jgi:hypothetical protein
MIASTLGRPITLLASALLGVGALVGCGSPAASGGTQPAGSAAANPANAGPSAGGTAAPGKASGGPAPAAGGLCDGLPDLTKVGELAAITKLGQATEDKKNYACTLTGGDDPTTSVTFYRDTSGTGWDILGPAIGGRPRDDLIPGSLGGTRTVIVTSGTTVYGVQVVSAADPASAAAEARAAKILKLWGKA